MTAPRVVVVGAGITGLSAAFTLQEDARRAGVGLDLRVLDAGPRPGGHVQTRRVDGFVIEAGPNGFINREPHTLALVDALGLQDALIAARPEAARRFVVRDGRLRRAPDGPVTLLTSSALSWRGRLRLLAEPFIPARTADAEETIHDFAARRFGTEAADYLADAAVAGISAGDSRLLSVEAMFPTLVALEREHGSVVRGLLRRPRAEQPRRLLSFRDGMGTIVDALGARLAAVTRTATPVRALQRGLASWQVVLDDGSTLAADHVVLAISARAAADLVGPWGIDVFAALDQFTDAGMSVVALGYRAADLPKALDGYGYVVGRGEGLSTLGVVWESSVFPHRAAEGTVLLRVMLGGTRAPFMGGAPEAACVAVARSELAAVTGITADPVHVSVCSWPGAIGQYTLGHARRCATLRAAVYRHPGLWVCGTAFDGISFNEGVKSGRLTARRLADRLWAAGAPMAEAGALTPTVAAS